ncbi:MAG: response regulator transcription factor [Cyanobacteria bacterium SZAS TMP-1]|nr:response regulator transcription factor [Cyanobacteria bacterium SZAS TMP-1]
MAKLLIVDDDPEIGKSLDAYLSNHGYTLEMCPGGQDAQQLLTGFKYDLIVLDWNLPGVNGDKICRDYRAQGGQAPIIFLTGNDQIDFLETALEAGADDYMVKPFNVRELHARIKTLLRRRTGTFQQQLEMDGLVLDPEKGVVTVGASSVRLRAKEVALLEYLMRNSGKVFSSQMLFEAVWPSDTEGTSEAVRTWINFLRQKLAQVGKAHILKTILGSGYTINPTDKQKPQ